MKIEPFGNNVIVAVARHEEAKSAGGIITVMAGSPYHRAEVMAVGEGLLQADGGFVKPQSKVGDVALLPKNSEMILVFSEDGRDFYVVDDRSLLAKFNDKR